MIRIMAHRGCWQNPRHANSLDAIKTAFVAGMGVETDIRDQNGQLVISHDPPLEKCLNLQTILNLKQSISPTSWLALNIKSDGLAKLVQNALKKAGSNNVAVFDMSQPDMMNYLRSNVPFLVRLSEFEDLNFFQEAEGVWLDQFESNWFSVQQVRTLCETGKHIFVVSPELHGRVPHSCWDILKEAVSENADLAKRLHVCTDLINEASEYLKGS